VEKQRKASPDREIQVFAISSCLQVERVNRDSINVLKKERRLLTRFVRKQYRHSNYVRSYKIFLFFRAPSICDDRGLFLLQGPYSVSQMCLSVPAGNPPPRVGGRWVGYVCTIYELTGSCSRQLSLKIMTLQFHHHTNTRPARTKPQLSLSHK
jgi:hypothetical protein